MAAQYKPVAPCNNCQAGSDVKSLQVTVPLQCQWYERLALDHGQKDGLGKQSYLYCSK